MRAYETSLELSVHQPETKKIRILSRQAQLLRQSLSVREIQSSNLRSAKLDIGSTTARYDWAYLRSCVTQALNRGDGPRHSLHVSAQYREYNENLVFFLIKNLIRSSSSIYLLFKKNLILLDFLEK